MGKKRERNGRRGQDTKEATGETVPVGKTLQSLTKEYNIANAVNITGPNI